MGVVSTVEYVKLYSWDKLWFESDSTYIVDLLRKKSITIPWKYRSKWIHALSFLATITYKATHIFQEDNAVVDKLASHGIHLRNTQWWFYFWTFVPTSLRLISLDCQTTTFDLLGKCALFFPSNIFPTKF